MTSKTMDNRISCAVVIEAMKSVRPERHEAYLFTVQEELGLRGAKAAAYGINPDVGIAVDVTTWGVILLNARLLTSCLEKAWLSRRRIQV